METDYGWVEVKILVWRIETRKGQRWIFRIRNFWAVLWFKGKSPWNGKDCKIIFYSNYIAKDLSHLIGSPVLWQQEVPEQWCGWLPHCHLIKAWAISSPLPPVSNMISEPEVLWLLQVVVWKWNTRLLITEYHF